MKNQKWKVSPDFSALIIDENNVAIAETLNEMNAGRAIKKKYDILSFDDIDVIKANAHLIAAAPDMYEALSNLENDDGKQMPPSAWKLVQDALKKARGE